MYYIKAKQQKKKEEMHLFYALPQHFYKKFIIKYLYIVHKSILNAFTAPCRPATRTASF